MINGHVRIYNINHTMRENTFHSLESLPKFSSGAYSIICRSFIYRLDVEKRKGIKREIKESYVNLKIYYFIAYGNLCKPWILQMDYMSNKIKMYLINH